MSSMPSYVYAPAAAEIRTRQNHQDERRFHEEAVLAEASLRRTWLAEPRNEAGDDSAMGRRVQGGGGAADGALYRGSGYEPKRTRLDRSGTAVRQHAAEDGYPTRLHAPAPQGGAAQNGGEAGISGGRRAIGVPGGGDTDYQNDNGRHRLLAPSRSRGEKTQLLFVPDASSCKGELDNPVADVVKTSDWTQSRGRAFRSERPDKALLRRCLVQRTNIGADTDQTHPSGVAFGGGLAADLGEP